MLWFTHHLYDGNERDYQSNFIQDAPGFVSKMIIEDLIYGYKNENDLIYGCTEILTQIIDNRVLIKQP